MNKMDFLNTLDIHFLFYVFVMLTVFFGFYLTTAKRQKAAVKMVELTLKHQEKAIQQANLMLAELKRSNFLLSELAGMEFSESDRAVANNAANNGHVFHNGSTNGSNFHHAGHQGSTSHNGSHNSFHDDHHETTPHKLYVGNIDYAATEDELAHHFSMIGSVEFVNIPINRYTGRARGFGFVTFRSREDAERAMDLNGSEFRGRQIQVNFAKEREAIN